MQPVAELQADYLSDVEQAAIAQGPTVLQRNAKARRTMRFLRMLALLSPKYSEAAFGQDERLYYRIKLVEKAGAYFERLIKNSVHPDGRRIRV